MKLYFVGADHEVTGSCHVLEVAGKYIIMDYGMEQGRNVYENAPLPCHPSQVTAVLLSHAHIDHSGMLPKLYKEGFTGKVYCTEATRELCDIMLKDSAHIQESETEWKNRKAMRSGNPIVEPAYTVEDAEKCMKLFESHEYGEEFAVTDEVSVRFEDAGHILGSSIVHVDMKEAGVARKLVFSGDLGNIHMPLLNDPTDCGKADYVIMESTYGDRVHEEVHDQIGTLAKLLQETFDKGGNFVMPCFAVGRTQEMLYFLREIRERDLVHVKGGWDVYIDSPLAEAATKIFEKNEFGYYDEEALRLIEEGDDPLIFDGLKLAASVEESRAINLEPGPKVILSASGMCEAGRIRHHLKHNLWRKECTICFAGYQAEGTLGRKLLDGETDITLFGEEISVNARIAELQDVSAHADKNELRTWLDTAENPKQVFIVHGDDQVATDFAAELRETHGFNCDAPFSGSIYDLMSAEWLNVAEGKPVKDERTIHRDEVKKAEEAEIAMNADVYEELQEAMKKLASLSVRAKIWKRSNIQKFTREILKLVKRWK